MIDPNPQVAGKGAEALRQSGIAVETGVLEEQCRELNKGFIKFMTTGLPHVIYKTAMTLDGAIATITGHSRWVTGEEARRLVHRLRSRSDAVMVGVDTVIVDNPQLTVRHVKGRDPLRVVVDTRLRTPESVAVLSGTQARHTIIATCETNPRVHRRYLLQGATVLVCDEYEGRVSMPDLLRKLGDRGVRTVLLEGGSRLAGQMLQSGLIDEFMLFYAPKIIGNDGFSAFALQGITTMDQALKLRILDVRMIGPDLLLHAVPEVTCSPV
jgi:diaminohydroxyphosphoribosylaminopyrimidine deaminase/5-amino-6-(5-phosphoribosylamino)uracil reductase